MNAKPIIPVFYACDDNFVKFTMVSIASMLENASDEYRYEIHILHTDIQPETMTAVYRMQRPGVEIRFDNVSAYLRSISDILPIRDYYTKTTYFRLFIAEMFPGIKKAVYIDSDTVVIGDISKMYETELTENDWLGACHEQAMVQEDVYGTYVERCLGIDRNSYFNAGVLLINCEQFRRQNILGKFAAMLRVYNFVVTQDEDYLNVICHGHVKFLHQGFNTEVFGVIPIPENEICVLHYIMVSKPWHFPDCRYGEYFWEYAAKTEVYRDILKIAEDYTDEQRKSDFDSCDRLAALARSETLREDNYLNTQKKNNCSPDRQKILDKIDRFELEGRFDEDVEDDPPGRTIMPSEVDYTQEKIRTRVMAKLSHFVAKRYLNHIVKNGDLVVKEIIGSEHLDSVRSGAVLTCNHFNAMDSFAMQMAYMSAPTQRRRKLFRVIREGNYTSFPGFFGFLMRHFYTLPLSSNIGTQKEFIHAVDTLLRRGDFVLVYPEQSMWWNYRKPKPLKSGAYYFAARNGLPVVPCFITMSDSDRTDSSGFPVQEYTIHISKPIYPDPEQNVRENTRRMLDENFGVWKNIYETVYGIPLEYKTVKEAADL